MSDMACPICDASIAPVELGKVILVYGAEHRLVECRDCRVIRFDPLPTIDQLQRFYAAPYYDFDRGKEEGKGMAFAGRLKRWRKTGRFLDVGCATGFFINGIHKHSEWDVHGVEFGESAVRYARDELGLDVKHGDLTHAGYPDAYFDYVHINNVLEHVLDPVGMLRECRRIVKPDGRLYLSVPNGYNDSREIVDFHRLENQPSLSNKGHIFFFQARTLLEIFDRSGFLVISKKTYGIKRGLRNLGWLPRKKNWKETYRPPAAPEPEMETGKVIVTSSRKRPAIYYRYRFFESSVRMIPGLHKFGLDLAFILQPNAERKGKTSR